MRVMREDSCQDLSIIRVRKQAAFILDIKVLGQYTRVYLLITTNKKKSLKKSTQTLISFSLLPKSIIKINTKIPNGT